MAERFRTPYGGYDVLRKWDSPSWDETTREVVRKRLQEVPARRFLSADEWETLEAVCARLLPQPDRGPEAIPVVPFIDRKLEEGAGVGYRYEGMPGLRTAWRQGLAAIEAEARERAGSRFVELGQGQQDELLSAIQQGDVRADTWEGLPPGRFFSDILLKTAVGIYYAHPAAWSEAGFGGPASPRGYVRRELGRRDPWEGREDWNPASPGGGGE